MPHHASVYRTRKQRQLGKNSANMKTSSDIKLHTVEDLNWQFLAEGFKLLESFSSPPFWCRSFFSYKWLVAAGASSRGWSISLQSMHGSKGNGPRMSWRVWTFKVFVRPSWNQIFFFNCCACVVPWKCSNVFDCCMIFFDPCQSIPCS